MSITFDKIYQYIDNGEYNKAQELCQRPEIASHPLTLALSSYSYAASRQIEKAIEVGKKLIEKKPRDEVIINTQGCAFKLCYNDELFAKLYENSLELLPDVKENFLIDLFYCYSRLKEFKKMQVLGQKLLKVSGNNKYICWIVSSILLQDDPTNKMNSMMLNLAEKMMKKFLEEVEKKNLLPGGEELHIYIIILLKLKKYSECIEEIKKLITSTSTSSASAKIDDDVDFKKNSNKVLQTELNLNFILLDIYLNLSEEDFLDQLHLFKELKENLKVLAYKILEKDLPDQWNLYQILLQHEISTSFQSNNDSLRLPLYAGNEWDSVSDLMYYQEKFQKINKDFLFYNHLINSTNHFNINEFKLLNNNNNIQSFITLSNFLKLQQQKNLKLRGPYLAEIYLFFNLIHFTSSSVTTLFTSRLKEIEEENKLEFISTNSLYPLLTPQYRLLFQLISLYIFKFQSKYNCFLDLKPVLSHFYQFNILNDREEEVILFLTLIRDFTQLHLTELEKKLIPLIHQTIEIKKKNEEKEKEDQMEKEKAKDKEEHEDESKALSKNAKKRQKKKTSANSTTNSIEIKTIDPPKLKEKVSIDEPVLLELCKYTQLDYFSTYSELLPLIFSLSKEENKEFKINKKLDEVSISSSKMNYRNDLFKLSYLLFKNGIGGEVRVVQPGDDLLLINSSIEKIKIYTSLYQNNLTIDPTTYQKILLWASSLYTGVLNSTYSYSLKIQFLEAASLLHNGKFALEVYSNLGVKSIQADSLSYLLLNTLSTSLSSTSVASLETLSNTILRFHQSCQREASDVMSQAFEFSNYNKVLELQSFIDDAAKSLTLHLAKHENICLNLIKNDKKDMKKYLESVLDLKEKKEEHSTLLPYLTSSSLNNLSCNNDYKILNNFLERSIDYSKSDRISSSISNEFIKDRLQILNILNFISASLYDQDSNKFSFYLEEFKQFLNEKFSSNQSLYPSFSSSLSTSYASSNFTFNQSLVKNSREVELLSLLSNFFSAFVSLKEEKKINNFEQISFLLLSILNYIKNKDNFISSSSFSLLLPSSISYFSFFFKFVFNYSLNLIKIVAEKDAEFKKTLSSFPPLSSHSLDSELSTPPTSLSSFFILWIKFLSIVSNSLKQFVEVLQGDQAELGGSDKLAQLILQSSFSYLTTSASDTKEIEQRLGMNKEELLVDEEKKEKFFYDYLSSQGNTLYTIHEQIEEKINLLK